MAVAYVTSGQSVYTNAATSRSVSITTPDSGDLIVVVAATHRPDRGAATAVEDQLGDAFTLIESGMGTTSNDTGGDFYYKIADGDETSIEITYGGSGRHAASWAIYSGVASTSPLEDSAEDLTEIDDNTAKSCVTGTATPVSADGVAIYALATADGNDWVDGFASSSGTVRQSPTEDSYNGTALADEIYSSAANKSTTFTTTELNGEAAYGAVGVFKAAAAGGTDALLADDVESASEVSSAAIGQTHALLADDVESASEVSSAAIGQTHALLADDVESASEVSTATIGQVHALLADDVESASQVSKPTLAESTADHALLADDVESASEVSTAAIGQIHALLADDVESITQVSIPAIGQTHVILADDVESATELSKPAIADSGSITNAMIWARLNEIWQIMGLDENNPMTVTPTARTSGTISQTISGDGVTSTTVTRDP